MPYFHDIDPVAVQIGPLAVHWYGLMYILGIGAGWWLGIRRARHGRLGLSEQAVSDLVFYAAMGVILGGRIGYMLFYGGAQLIENPLALFKVWEGGMSFHGGLLGVLLATWIWARRQKLPYWDMMDFVAPLVPPGLFFGRMGNFIGGELWGRTTDAPWAVIFPSSLEHLDLSRDVLLAMYQRGELNAYARHPSQLYEALLEGVVLFAVLWWFSAKPRPRYAVSGLFALLYGSFRFAVEFVRQPDAHLGYLAFDWFTMGQLLSLPLIGVGLLLLWLSRSAPVATAAGTGHTAQTAGHG
jgi:phosphatidylglycerol:prolipoprotein diacylglycerol transferase